MRFIQRVIFTLALIIWVPMATAQENIFHLALSTYAVGYIPIDIHIHALSNKGISAGYQRVSSIRYPKQFYRFLHMLEVTAWNNSVLDRYPDTIRCSISSIALAYTPAITIPIKVGESKVLPSVGYKSRLLLYSSSKITDFSGEFVGKDRGYRMHKDNLYSGVDRLSIAFIPKFLGNFTIALEADALILSLVLKSNAHAYTYVTTDEYYSYYNLNLRLCYKID